MDNGFGVLDFLGSRSLMSRSSSATKVKRYVQHPLNNDELENGLVKVTLSGIPLIYCLICDRNGLLLSSHVRDHSGLAVFRYC